MSKRHVLLMVALTSLSLAQTASAQLNFGKKCAEGPVRSVPPGTGTTWGPESSCHCTGLRGGALVGSNNYGFLWSEGTGVVALELQVQTPDGIFWGSARTADDRYYISINGSGLTEPIQPIVNYTWTGKYRASCFR